MSMSAYVFRIRKRLLHSLGITEDFIEKNGGILNTWIDPDGIPAGKTLTGECREVEQFYKEYNLFRKLESYKNIYNIPINNKYDYAIRIYTLDDFRRLLQDVKNKNVKLHYETEEEFNNNTISEERKQIIHRLEEIINDIYSDKYYYVVYWW